MPEEAIRGRVMVVEDEAYVRQSLADLLGARGFDVQLAAGVDEAIAGLARMPIDVVLTDLKMPGQGGDALVRRVRAAYPDLPVIVLTGHGTVRSAVECLREGASDYILKPADPEALVVALDRAMSQRALRLELDYLRQAAPDADDPETPIGESPAWTRVMRTVQAVAPSDSTVLLLGESGTGKELVARQIHRLSRRADRPYVRVNCAAVPMDIWESEFFGHRRGAFTGAAGDRDGRFRLAHRGTLFMDEIGAMPQAAQAKILRVLQDGEFDRLGDEKPTRVDVRVVAATNTDLDAAIAAGTFRQDLFYRLNVVRIDLPPLRDRPEDIPLLAKRFVGRLAARIGRAVPRLGSDALRDLTAYNWPGNVRELRNVLERALILDPGDTVGAIDLPPAPPPAESAAGAASGELNLRTALLGHEKEIVLEALRRSGGVRKEAARLLGVDQRNLGYYVRKHGLDPDRLPS